MPIWHKCGKEINWLKAYSEDKYEMSLNKEGEVIYEERERGDTCVSFECPECDEELFIWEGEAIEFLKGNRDELKEIVKEKLNKINEEKNVSDMS